MTGWYIGEALTVLLVLPVVVLLLHRLLKPVREIKVQVDEILVQAGALSGNLAAVPRLIRTKQLTETALGGVARYGAAIEKLL